MRMRAMALPAGLALALMLGVPAQARPVPKWTGAWSTSLMALGNDVAASPEDMRDATIRQVVRVSLGGNRLRICISNLFGKTPLTIDAASVALSGDGTSARIVPETLRQLTFGNKPKVIVAPGESMWTDIVALPLRSGSDVAISLHVPAVPDGQTGHGGARANSWFVHGDRTRASDLTVAKALPRWFFISGIETDAPAGRAVVVMGDSITDGYGVQPGTNQRWTDYLRVRLQRQPGLANVAVLNAGIGGNSIRHDGVGPKPLARLKREVLDVPGVSHLVFLEGVNDLRGSLLKGPMTAEQHGKLVRDIIENLRQIVAQTRARGIKVIGATILPFGRSMDKATVPFDPAGWRQVNDWIRTPGNFDGVVDFARIMADPASPDRLRPEYDNDGLHPSVAGYRAMAEAVPLSLFNMTSGR